MADEEERIPEPRATDSLLGQTEAEREFLHAFNTGRPAHAWLITGRRGIGKATLAFRLARTILSGDAPDAHDPGAPLFRRVASGGHADLLVVERAVDEKSGKRRAEITVDDVRGVREFLSKTPAEGGWRVVVIDSADQMNANAANAVLKILEEPPSRAMLLLLAHNPGRLLPTIVSRCRRLPAKPLGEEDLAELLARLRPEMSLEDRQILVQIADGSIGRALGYSEGGGLGLYRDAVALLENLPGLDMAGVHKLADGVARDKTGEAFQTVGDLMRWWVHRSIDGRVRGSVSASAGGLDRWFEVWEKNNRLFERADSVNLDHKQVILNAFAAIDAAHSSS